jgi:hypothetical protein
MTKSKKPTPETQNSPATPDPATDPNPANETPTTTGFFNRVRGKLDSQEAPVHPSEAAEIVIMEEDSK